jgi:hypothetical protein
MEKGGWFVRVASLIWGFPLSQACSSGVRVTIGSGVELCALTKSVLTPEIKIKTTRNAMVSDLGRVFIILVPHVWLQITMIHKMNSINEQNFNKLLSGERIDRERIKC